MRLGREKVSHGGTRAQVALDREGSGDDLKESFEIGRDNSDVPGEENRWPNEDEEGGGGSLVGFKTAMMAFYDQCQTIHEAIMRGVALALGLPAGFFDEYLSDGENTMRLLHYPAVAKKVLAGGARVRAGAHTDYGSVTLLFQDARGGLQVERLADGGGGGEGGVGGGFMDVEPRPGTVVVNAGDLMTRWSNGLVRSTVHRVVEPPPPVLATDNDDDDEGEVNGGGGGGQGYPARYSIAYFGNPNFDRWIDALPGTWEGDKGGKKFEPVKSGDYLVSRLSATY